MTEEQERPASWRLHRAHPALGLEELEHDVLFAPNRRVLGVRWLALDPAEQRQREADLVAALEEAAADPASGWELELEMSEDGTRGVWMDRWKASALERELLDRVWTQARSREQSAAPVALRRRREVDRTLRAHVLVAWDRHAFRAFIAVMVLAGLLGLHPWGDGSIGAVAARVAVAVVVLIALGALIERWYRRSARTPE
jgi:hypothetical protein